MFKLDLYVALVCVLFPLGWSMSGFRPNIVGACVCWGAAVILLLHAFWIFEKTARLSVSTKACISAVVIVFIVGMAWSPVATEFQREHFTVDSAAFIKALKAQTGPRYVVRIGCPPNSEEACVFAGHFLDFFREAGWVVEGNSIQRVQLGKPEAGILLVLHGTGTIDPTNPHSGLWVLQSPSLVTITKAFAGIGLTAGQRADQGMPEGVVAIHFGYRSIAP